MAMSLLGFYMTEHMGVSKTHFGLVEGIAIGTAFLSKFLAGALSDIVSKRLLFISLGSFGSFCVKPLLAITTATHWVFFARLLDRFSKGIRAAPTDALIGDLSHRENLFKNFGLRQTFYAAGAICGALFAQGTMSLTQDYHLLFGLSAFPGALSILVLLLFVKEPSFTQSNQVTHAHTFRWEIKNILKLPATFWMLLAVASILMLARFSENFLLFRAREAGFAISTTPLLLVAYELVHACIAYPLGKLADRSNQNSLLLIGMATLVLANCVLFNATNHWLALLGILLAGTHMGLTQGLLAGLVSQSAPRELRGTAFGLFYLVCGGSIIVSNTLAGYLSDLLDGGPFIAGACFSAVALLLSLMQKPAQKKNTPSLSPL
jgi:MFS family permease